MAHFTYLSVIFAFTLLLYILVIFGGWENDGGSTLSPLLFCSKHGSCEGSIAVRSVVLVMFLGINYLY